MQDAVCELCAREVPATTEHHLVPRSEGKRKGKRTHELPTAALCSACHRQIHALFTNRELATKLADLAALRQEPSVERYLAWIRRQPGTRGIRVRR